MVANYVSTKSYSHVFTLKINQKGLIKVNGSFKQIREIDELLGECMSEP